MAGLPEPRSSPCTSPRSSCRIVAGRDHHPAGRAQMLHPVGERRSRSNAIRQAHRDSGSGGSSATICAKRWDKKRVSYPTQMPRAESSCSADITGDGSSRETHVMLGEIVSENPTPAIRPEFDGFFQNQINSSCFPASSLTTRRTSCDRSRVVIRMASSVSTTTRSSTPTSATNFSGL